MAKYYEESPLYNVDWSGILGNVPRTNVGMVPIGNVWDYNDQDPFRKADLGPNWYKRPGYVQPRDPRVKDLLGYSAYDKVKGVPQLGISDQLVPKQIEYDRPEELEFNYDPNQPVPGGVYNTELNPYDPSSKFFPYEPDYSGIMAATALKESGDPIYDIALRERAPVFGSSVEQAEYMNPESEGLFGIQTTWPWSGRRNVGLNVPMLEKEKGKIDSTLLHEARHHYQSKYGFDIGNLSDEEMHNLIYQFQGMFYKNPVDPGRVPRSLTKKEADAFMAMRKQGKKWFQDQKQGFGEEKLTGEEKWEMEQDRKQRLLKREFEKELGVGGSYGGGEDVGTFDRPARPISSPRGQEARRPRPEPTYRPPSGPRGQGARRPISKRQQRTRSRGAQRQTRRARIDTTGLQEGGLVSINHITRRL